MTTPRRARRVPAVVLAVLLAGCGGSAVADSTGACAFISANEADELTGVDMDAGRFTSSGAGCWYLESARKSDRRTLFIDVDADIDETRFGNSRSRAEVGSVVEDLPIGDQAYAVEHRSGATVVARKGRTLVTVVDSGGTASMATARETVELMIERRTEPGRIDRES